MDRTIPFLTEASMCNKSDFRPIQVMVPQLPSHDRLIPYLIRIDNDRRYTNFGPLVAELETSHALRWRLDRNCVTTVSNATVGLTIGLQASNAAPGTFCMMPAWTFVASPLAAISAGLIPYFVDVDPDTWALSPTSAVSALAQAPGRVGAVMPVLPFGQPLQTGLWDDFTLQTGIPVVLDAAAGVDGLKPGKSLSVVSLHATKLLGAGEGGLVLSSDCDAIARVRALSSFGFRGSRLAQLAGTNAKMSEYQAAIGLAALADWPKRRSIYIELAKSYAEKLCGLADVQTGFGEEWVGPTYVVRLRHGCAANVAARLARKQIETRQWWESGAHAHPATREFPRADLPVTETLVSETIGLPFHTDLTERDLIRIASELA